MNPVMPPPHADGSTPLRLLLPTRTAGHGRGRRLAALLAATGMLVALAGTAWAAELPLVRVVLSTAGLAQFTHSGTVTGGTSVDLAVRLDQVDDILKSLTVFDREGAIGAVTLPGKAPLAELWRDLPFGPDALDSPTALLNALVGSEVEIAGPVAAKGRVFRVEPEEVKLPNDGGTITRHRLTLMSEGGLVQAVLEDVTGLRFTDPEARAQIARALAGVSENRAKDRRRLSIGFLGQGTRQAAIGYVVAAPVWKTSYRLVLPKDGGKARLQGWAVVENLTGGDWSNVELVLVSGNPVALKQPLYTAFFSDRVEVPVTTAARLMPRTDDADDRRAGTAAKSDALRFGRERRLEADVAPAAAPPPMVQFANPSAARVASGAPREPSIMATAQAAESEDGATQLLYRFPEKISLATGHTLMVPFVDREVTATRTFLYQPETSERRPFAAVRVRNDGDASLPPGIVTAFDGSGAAGTTYAGDAQLPLLARGAVKFVTFALDSKTDIRREDQGIRRTVLGKAVNGELTTTVRARRTIAYEITPPADEDREIVIEEARGDGWAPAAGSKDVEETPTRFRAKVSAPKGVTTKATLVLEKTDQQNVLLTDLAAEEIFARVRGLQNESTALKETVARLGALVGEINAARAQRTQLDQERKRIGDDQERIRRNLSSVGQGSDLGRRYLDTLKTQEDRLAEIGRADQALETTIAAKRQDAIQVARQLKL